VSFGSQSILLDTIGLGLTERVVNAVVSGLTRTADTFFIFFGTISLTTFTIGGESRRLNRGHPFCRLALMPRRALAFFRMLAALLGDESLATTVAGLAVLDFTVYTGYVRSRATQIQIIMSSTESPLRFSYTIPRPSMVVWWRWLSYCNPLAFAFESERLVAPKSVLHSDPLITSGCT
jgi:ATP-binding cassette subfamily G (WHITE) protein 2 (SNQ2)